ncbi:MAG: 5-formyltetrahydrofolate cyclo-ligase [Eubacterium sp.]|jgi:5-formyltetrahydrofolate cyclo-ligase|nr:5-formyltetrahydrofolate cyclo-ligase [Eubacterium sp.]
MDKAELRKTLIATRIIDHDRAKKDGSILKKLISSDIFKKTSVILSYVSVKEEIDTKELISYCIRNSKRIAAPKIIGKDISFFYINNPCDLVVGQFGIPEPNGKCEIFNKDDLSSSICITPALAYNEQNFRLGYGGGYYDRFLSRYSGISIGLCYKENMIEFSTEEHDIPVDQLIISEC